MTSTARMISQSKSVPLAKRIEIHEDYAPRASSSPSFNPSSTPDLQVPSPLLQKSLLSETGFHVIDNAIPYKNKPLSIFDFNNKVKNTNSASFHKVYRVKKNNPKDPDACYFFKKNKMHSLMSELEATACHFYQFLIPGYVPTAHAHYDDSDKTKPYIGISSKGIPGFKSTMEDPLTKEDLSNKKIVKGLANCLAASYIFEEDDLHRGNMSKYGQRIDFDMSLWTILCKFKESGYIDWTFRYPNRETYSFHPEDIKHFPNLTHAKPFYWPTNPPPVIPQSIYTVLSQIFPISKNSFRQPENEVYKKLELDPAFQYESNKVFLKYILSDGILFQSIAKLHIHDEAEDVIKILGKHQQHRISKLRETLLKMPEFKEFILHHGKQALGEIMQELVEWNQKIERKIVKHPERKDLLQALVINTDNTRERFGVAVTEVMKIGNKIKI